MRQALQDQVVRPQQRSGTFSIPAPSGGLNSRDPVSNLSPIDAVLLDNFIAYPGEIRMRKGATDHATGFGSRDVESLLPYRGQGGGDKLFAATNIGIYDATAAGAIGAAAVTVTNGRWQHVNFTNSAGSWLICCNGVDQLQEYNGSTWAAITNFGASFPTTSIIGIEVYQQRLFFVPTNKLAFWYLPTGAVTGTALEFNLGQICRRGGYTMAIATWTIDAGSGSDDHLAVVTSEGEVIVYKGTDPGSADSWALVGVYFIGRPLGRRCMTKYAGDVLLLTDRGLFPLSQGLGSATVSRETALSDKIQPTFVERAHSNFSSFGWEVCLDTGEAFLLVNAPGVPHCQFVMQFQSHGWSHFLGWEARCWTTFGGETYFGTATKVAKANFGSTDFGSAIQADCVPAFSYFERRGQQKFVSMIRPIFRSDGPFAYALGACTDFVVTIPTATISGITLTTALWDTSLWDTGVWVDEFLMTKEWRTVANYPGYAFAPYIRISSNSVRASLIAIDYVIKGGGVL